MNTLRALGALPGIFFVGSGTAWSQPAPAYPVKPVRVVVVFPAGGATDVVARIVFQKMSELVNQQFPIDNRAGAGGMIGAEFVSKSAPDGYTLMVYSQTLLANAHLYQKQPYDSLKDFIGVAALTRIVNMLAVHPALPVRNVKDLITLAKARPGEVLYGSAGIGASQHLSMSIFTNMAGVKMNHVPFKGGAPAVVALMGGDIQAIMTPIPEVSPHLKSGRLRPIAVSSAKRTTQFPDIPAIGETVPGFDFTAWFGTFVPAGTPRPIVDKLSTELGKAVGDPDTAAKLSAQGLDPMYMNSEAFAKHLKWDYDRLRDVVKQSGARIE